MQCMVVKVRSALFLSRSLFRVSQVYDFDGQVVYFSNNCHLFIYFLILYCLKYFELFCLFPHYLMNESSQIYYQVFVFYPIVLSAYASFFLAFKRYYGTFYRMV